jgi:copper chaperone CopZ
MRALGYLAVALLTGGLVFTAVMRTTPPADQGSTAAKLPDSIGDPITLNVPTMHCPIACYPKVKATLESQPGVLAVELVPQKKEGEIDRPEVIIKTKDGFDLAAATSALSKAGFADAAVVQ